MAKREVKMMKRNKAVLLILCLSLLVSLLAGCGGNTAAPAAPAKTEAAKAGESAEATEEETEEASEDAGSGGAAGKETEVPICHESGREGIFVIDLPEGYRYDDAWSCYYSDKTGVRMWVGDTNIYETPNEFENAREMYEGMTEVTAGDLHGWKHEEPAGFYGAETHYYLSLAEYYEGFSGCHVMVTSEAGDMPSTQTQDILDALATIRKTGEAVGERKPLEGAAAGAGSSEGNAENAETEAEDADPYESLVIDFTPAQTGAMSTFMSAGHYAVDGDSIYGHAFGSDGTVELVRMDLKQVGDFVEVIGSNVLDKGYAPTYVTLYGNDVYYIRYGQPGIYKVGQEGGEPELVVPDAADYLQIRKDKLYYCNADYRFCEAELDGSNVTTVIDKEVYFPYFINDDWMIYQDDADDESLYLRHIQGDVDFPICPIPTYSPVIYGSDLYCVTSSNGDKTLAKIDMTYTPDSINNFGIEYGTLPEAADISISPDGYLFYGPSTGLEIGRWQDAENPDAVWKVSHRYFGEDFGVHWELDDGKVTAIYVTLVETGGSQSIGRFD